MAAIQLQFADPAITVSGGTLNINFADGSQIPFEGGANELQLWILARLPELDVVRAMAIANRLAQDPLLDSPQLWDGKTVTLDVEQANPANVFKVQ